MGANREERVDMYTKHCRSILEYAVPVCNGSITGYESKDIERIQKMVLHIILGENYLNYEQVGPTPESNSNLKCILSSKRF